AAKLRRTQDKIIHLRQYSKLLTEFFQLVYEEKGNSLTNFFDQRDKGKILIIAFSSNRGLCGSFNANVIREVNNFINNLTDEEKENTEIITIGKKIYDGLKKNNYQIVGRYDELIDKLDYDAIKNLTKLWVQDFIDNKYQKIIFIHNKFKNAAQQFVNIYQ